MGVDPLEIQWIEIEDTLGRLIQGTHKAEPVSLKRASHSMTKRSTDRPQRRLYLVERIPYVQSTFDHSHQPPVSANIVSNPAMPQSSNQWSLYC